MATIKSYTDLEQSRKLAAILPLESADMYWSRCTITDFGDGVLKVSYAVEPCNISQFRNTKEDIPCWSLAALLSIFDCYEINKFGNNIQFDTKDIALSTKENETILDIVVDTIILLHKQNLL